MTPHAQQTTTNPLLPSSDLLEPPLPLPSALTHNANATKKHQAALLALQKAQSLLTTYEALTLQCSQPISTILSTPHHATKQKVASDLLDSFATQRELVAQIQDAVMESQLCQHQYHYQGGGNPVPDEQHFHAKIQDLTSQKLKLLAGDATIAQNRPRVVRRVLGICNEHQRFLEAATTHVTDFFYWDILCYKNDIGLPAQQDCFRKELLEYYESRREHDPKQAHLGQDAEYLWCPIYKRCFQERYISMVQFVPSQMGYETVSDLFRQPPGEGGGCLLMWSVENGMLMTRELEEAFREGTFVLVPVEKPGEPDGWKLVLIDEGMRHEMANASQIWDELDGVELEFRNQSRPGRAFVYFAYCMALWRTMQGTRRLEWAALKERIESRELWTVPGRYLRMSMFRDLAGLIGDGVVLPEAILQDGDMKSEGEVPIENVKDLASALLNGAEFDEDG